MRQASAGNARAGCLKAGAGPVFESPCFGLYLCSMGETNSSGSVHQSWRHHARKALQANAFCRGMAGSFALISLFSETVSLENYETADAINAIIIGWDRIAGSVGRWIGVLPLMPALDATVINILIFLASVTLPSLFGILELVGPIWKERNRREWFVTFVLPPAMFLSLGYIFVCGPLLFFTGNLEFLKQSVPEGLPDNAFMTFTSQSHYLSYVLMSLVMPFIVALLIKPYRRGVLLIAGALCTVEVLYFAPVAGDQVRAFTRWMQSG